MAKYIVQFKTIPNFQEFKSFLRQSGVGSVGLSNTLLYAIISVESLDDNGVRAQISSLGGKAHLYESTNAKKLKGRR